MKLTLGQIVQLFNELNGQVVNSQTGERSKGVLGHKLSIRAKHILQNDLNKKIMEYVKEFEESRLELFKEMIAEGKGEEKDGMIIIHPENQQELIEKIGELETIEKSVEVPKLNAGELYNIETEDYFPVLLDVLLARPKEEEVKEAEIVPL
jgi:hypothetical protein